MTLALSCVRFNLNRVVQLSVFSRQWPRCARGTDLVMLALIVAFFSLYFHISIIASLVCETQQCTVFDPIMNVCHCLAPFSSQFPTCPPHPVSCTSGRYADPRPVSATDAATRTSPSTRCCVWSRCSTSPRSAATNTSWGWTRNWTPSDNRSRSDQGVSSANFIRVDCPVSNNYA